MTALAQPMAVRVTSRGIASDLRAIKVVMVRDLIRTWGDKTRLISSLIQPLLFLFVLGAGLSSLTRSSTGQLDFKTFMYPGVLATSTLFTAVFSAMSIVWDREFGFLREMLVAPVRRSSIMVGKALAGASIATLQGLLVLALAPLAHVHLTFGLALTLMSEVFLLSFMLTALGLVVVARIQKMQTVMGIIQMILLPMTFLSGSLYPTAGLPTWLGVVVRLNPVTYAVHPVRNAVFKHLHVPDYVRARLAPPLTWDGWIVPIWLQLVIVGGLGLVMLAVAIWQFQKIE